MYLTLQIFLGDYYDLNLFFSKIQDIAATPRTIPLINTVIVSEQIQLCCKENGLSIKALILKVGGCTISVQNWNYCPSHLFFQKIDFHIFVFKPISPELKTQGRIYKSIPNLNFFAFIGIGKQSGRFKHK